MQVNFHPPSEADATVEGMDGSQVTLKPVFYAPNGPAILGTFVSHSQGGQVLDRAIIAVNGKGKISVSHRNEPVAPTIDAPPKQEKADGGAASGAAAKK